MYYNATQNDFNYDLGEVIRFNILNYDIDIELYKIHRALHQAYTLQLFQLIQ